MIDLEGVLKDLAAERPIFHSEADFQHALAWRIHKVLPEAKVRLEFKLFCGKRFYLDLWIRSRDASMAVELKYLTRGLTIQVGDETFELKDQAAQDISRYDFVKDLVRLESVVEAFPEVKGYALLLTNDSAYWKTPAAQRAVDTSFRVHEGRKLEGHLAWADHAGKGTTKGRTASLLLSGRYDLHWRDYSMVSSDSYGKFRYLLVRLAR